MMHLILILIALFPIINSSSIDVLGSIDASSIYAIKDLVNAYKLIDPSLEATMIQSIDDQATIQAIARKEVDFGIVTTDISISKALSNPSLYMVPFLLTSLVPIYRLDALSMDSQSTNQQSTSGEFTSQTVSERSINSMSLIIPRDVLSRIYMGEITNFQHPDLVKANPNVQLPNQNITLVIQDDISLTTHLKKALQPFYPAFNQSISQAIDDWPYHKYAKHRKISSSEGNTALLTSVATFDGSLAVCYHAGAVNMAANIARLINMAGVIVSVSDSSMALAASEMGTQQLLTRTSVANLIDASNAAAWPMSLFSYLVVDIENTRSTCRTKRSLIDLLLYFYQSPVITALLSDRNYAQVPDIIKDRLQIIDLLQSRMMCRGSRAFAMPATNQRLLGVAHQWLFNSRLLSALYLNVDKQATFTPQLANTNDLVVRQMMESEIDVALVSPSNVDDALWKQFVDSDDYVLIPLFATSISWFFNPQFAPDINLKQSMPAGVQFRVDPELILLIYTACVSHWNHPKVLELNPWLEPILANRSIRMNQMNSCAGNVQNGPAILEWAGLALTNQFETFTEAQMNRMGYCLSPTNPGLAMYGQALATCTSSEENGVFYVNNELIVPDLVLGRTASMGATVFDGDSAKLFPSIAQFYNTKAYYSQPTIQGMYACASDTYDPLTMTFDFMKSRSPDCYPLSRQTVAAVRKRYYSNAVVTNASSCARGQNALQFVRWLIQTDDLGAFTRDSGIGRLAQVSPAIKKDFVDALNFALCDDEPLLITLPIIWSISPALTGFGCAAAAIGLAGTIISFIFVATYHRNPILRAASPLLISISLIGIMIMFLSIILFVMPPSDATCAGVAWLFSLGLMTTFAPIFAKTWRVFKIFGGRRLKVVKISNRKLLTLCSVLLVIELLILIVWQVLSPLQPTLLEVIEGSPARVHEYVQCRVSDDIGNMMFIIDAIVLCALFVFGAYMCMRTRKVSSSFNEASQIGLTIYNCIFTIAIIAIIITVTEPLGDVHIGLCLVVAIWISFFTLFMLVLPKVLLIFGNNTNANGNNSIMAVSQDSQSAFSFLSLEMFTSLPMIGTYIAALRLHLEACEHKQSTLKRGKGEMMSTKSTQGPFQNSQNSQITAAGIPQPSPSGSIRSQDVNSNIGRRSTSNGGTPNPATRKMSGAVMVGLSSRASQ